MYGIENIKKSLLVVINFAESLENKLEDGKLSWPERFGLIKDLKDLPEIIANYKELVEEIRNLDEVEKSQLLEFVRAELDLENDRVETAIEAVLSFLQSLSELKSSISPA